MLIPLYQNTPLSLGSLTVNLVSLISISLGLEIKIRLSTLSLSSLSHQGKKLKSSY